MPPHPARRGQPTPLALLLRRSGLLRWLLLPQAWSWRRSRYTNREHRADAASMAVAAILARWLVFSPPAPAADGLSAGDPAPGTCPAHWREPCCNARPPYPER